LRRGRIAGIIEPEDSDGFRRRGVLRVLAVLALGISVLALLISSASTPYQPANARISGQTILAGFALIDQHKDTMMLCKAGVPCPPVPSPPHVPNDVKGVDLVYGTNDDCPHCSAYCAPASIAMIATFRGVGLPFTQQDDIYDAGKKTAGEIQGNGIIETHGMGMFSGILGTGSPWEVQDAFNWSIGLHIQHNQGDGTALTAAQLESYIVLGHPVLWLDHGGFPENLSSQAYSSSYTAEQGHAKVIAGYYNNDTADRVDDLCLIFDPWPEYNDKGILPVNATKGPGGSFDPYWLPLNDVNLSDPLDQYLVDTWPDIPEFQDVVLPVLGTVLAATAASAIVRRRTEPRD